jgi:myo-inositol-1(or 4)-monophosphatase
LPDADAASDLALLVCAAEEAGRIALGYFRNAPEVWYKNGGRSPVSAADMAVDAFLKDVLLSARPDYGWLSEETEDHPARLSHDRVFVVDPIDGTRAFVAGKDVWCVSVAVVRAGVPIAGVLVAPALGEVFTAAADGIAMKNGAPLRLPQTFDPSNLGALKFAAPESLTGGVADALGQAVERMPHVPSLAYRIAMVADGRLDATLVLPRSSDWDLAAADLILRRAGGSLLRLDGGAVIYNGVETSHGILVAASDMRVGGLARTVQALQANISAPPCNAIPKH